MVYLQFSHKFLKSNSSAITFLACGELFSKPVLVTPNNSNLHKVYIFLTEAQGCSPETLEWTLSAWSACDSNYLKSSASFQVYLDTSDYPLAAFGGGKNYSQRGLCNFSLQFSHTTPLPFWFPTWSPYHVRSITSGVWEQYIMPTSLSVKHAFSNVCWCSPFH